MKYMFRISRESSRESVWRRRDVRLLVAGRALPLLGDEIAVVGLTLWAYAAHWGTVGVAEMLVAATLPLALGAPLTGRIVDTVNSRTVTMAAAAWQAACVLALAAVTTTSGAGPAARIAVVVLVFLLNCGQAVTGPAWQALVPHAVPEADVGRVVSVTQASAGTASVIGPALGGLLASTWGVTTTLVTDAACLLAVVLVAALIHARRGPEAAGDGGPSDRWWAGFAVLRADAIVGPLILGLMAVAVFAHLIMVIAVFLIRGTLQAGPSGYGTVMAVIAGGAVIGSLAAGRVRGTYPRAWAVMGSTSAISGSLVLGGLSPSVLVLGLAMIPFGVGQGVLGVSLQSLLLARIPSAVRGRAVAAMIGGVQTCTVAGMAVGGAIGTAISPRALYLIAGSLGLLASLAVMLRLGARLRLEIEAEEGLPQPSAS
jgi:MFS family permease